jgi:peptidoglycan/xylan/chitin deacetylase (PgdA/CDA1 family)
VEGTSKNKINFRRLYRHRLTQTFLQAKSFTKKCLRFFLQAKSFTIKPLKRFNPKLKTFIEKWNGRYGYLSLRKPTRRVLDMLDEYDINATFFVVADVVEHYPGLVESIAERGHEIGCHGLHHACKIDLNKIASI